MIHEADAFLQQMTAARAVMEADALRAFCRVAVADPRHVAVDRDHNGRIVAMRRIETPETIRVPFNVAED